MKRFSPHPTGGYHAMSLQTRFLDILPRVELHGRIYFHFLSQDRKADVIQEMRALALLWYLRLIEKGKDPTNFMKAFTTFLARAVSSGRRLVGVAKAKDVLNPATQRLRG